MVRTRIANAVRLCFSLIATAALASGPRALGQAPSLVSGPIDPEQRVEIVNSVRHELANATDLGRADGGLELSAITIGFRTTAEQNAELDQLLENQVDPYSALRGRQDSINALKRQVLHAVSFGLLY